MSKAIPYPLRRQQQKRTEPTKIRPLGSRRAKHPGPPRTLSRIPTTEPANNQPARPGPERIFEGGELPRLGGQGRSGELEIAETLWLIGAERAEVFLVLTGLGQDQGEQPEQMLSQRRIATPGSKGLGRNPAVH